MTQLNTSSLLGYEVPFESQGVMADKVPQNEDISGGGKNGGRKKSVLLSEEEEQIGEHGH